MIGKMPIKKASMLICSKASQYRTSGRHSQVSSSTATREDDHISPPEIECQLYRGLYGTSMAILERGLQSDRNTTLKIYFYYYILYIYTVHFSN
jgi:hypothetical protein